MTKPATSEKGNRSTTFMSPSRFRESTEYIKGVDRREVLKKGGMLEDALREREEQAKKPDHS
ncbi:hypothetical protein [Kribbella kalugense]|uniref:Uncharacterized protein n=1 Tax=Kribbella kalugense TaxID=2512221 RepID=A0A4R7ZMA3_9ACTN|nr:hypothetical protein [Kribbella kalugense]TDW18977.1 hypothetical protein EV650_5580 [Kribbella kalugense]